MPPFPHLTDRRGESSAHPQAPAHGSPRGEALCAVRHATGKAREKPARVAFVCALPLPESRNCQSSCDLREAGTHSGHR